MLAVAEGKYIVTCARRIGALGVRFLGHAQVFSADPTDLTNIAPLLEVSGTTAHRNAEDADQDALELALTAIRAARVNLQPAG